MSTEDAQLEIHLRELRRGSVLLVCLLLLRSPDYGYGLLERLQTSGVDVDANTLYPLLRRLEAQGLLTSEWDTEGARPRTDLDRTRPGPLNDLLSALLGVEARLIARGLPLPWGSSVFAVGRKRLPHGRE